MVQRLPVRVDIDPADLAKHPLRIGLSTLVTVDTSDQSGAVLASTVRKTPAYQSNALELQLGQVNQVISDVIRANAG